MGVRRWFLHTSPRVGLAQTGLVGLLMRDIALTRDEVVGLMDGLLTSGEPPTGTTRLSDWLDDNADGLVACTCPSWGAIFPLEETGDGIPRHCVRPLSRATMVQGASKEKGQS